MAMIESALRLALKRRGYAMYKSRRRTNVPNLDNRGYYMIVDIKRNLVVEGERYDMTLRDCERFLDKLEK